jgi:Fic family protein
MHETVQGAPHRRCCELWELFRNSKIQQARKGEARSTHVTRTYGNTVVAHPLPTSETLHRLARHLCKMPQESHTGQQHPA